MFIDTHCHISFEQYNADRAMVIGNAKKAGVKKMICVGADLYSSRQSVQLALKHPGVIYASVGFHPYEASHSPSLDELENLLLTSLNSKLSTLNSIVAIGECGLDYHLYKNEKAAGKKQEQQMLFKEQLFLALKHNLPAIMHVRDAFDDFFHVLDDMPSLPRGVIHCFSGGLQEVRQAIKRKLYIGIDGNVTYSKQLSLIVPQIPLESILLETDAPYLTPIPHRGTRNEPKYIPIIATHLSGLLDKQDTEIQLQTTKNAQNLFGI